MAEQDGQGATPRPMNVTTTGKMGPVPEGTGLHVCIGCHELILPGQYFTLLPIGCGGDPEKRKLARAKLPYPPVFVPVHWACVTGDESESRLSIV